MDASSNSGSGNADIHIGNSGRIAAESRSRDVLQNLDLLELIFSHLAAPGSETLSKRDRKTLLRAGLTCKAFFEPAMKSLWCKMNSFLPLLLVIPLVVKRDGIYTSPSSLRKADFSRFEHYARHIRQISLPFFKENISTHIYMAIAEIFYGRPVFPRLTTVRITWLHGVSDEDFLWLHLITSSPLSAVNITKLNYIRLNSFIHDMSRLRSPHPLSALTLRGTFLPSTVNLLQNFTRLTNLTFSLELAVPDILETILKTSSSLPKLLELHLGLPDEAEDFRTNLRQESNLYTFPTLQHLSVDGPAPHVCDVLWSIFGACLSRITISLFPPDVDTKAEISKCIQRCIFMTPMLLHLSIHLPPTDAVLDDNMFTPFQRYRLLRSLEISALAPIRPYLLDLFDKKFGEWPVLETATFDSECGYDYSPDYQMHPTAPLHLPALSCPKLRKLMICLPLPFDDAACDSLQSLLDSSERTAHNLAELRITFLESLPLPSMSTSMEVKAGILLARAIDHLYPNLERVELCSDLGDDDREDWYRSVEMMVKNFREARQQWLRFVVNKS